MNQMQKTNVGERMCCLKMMNTSSVCNVQKSVVYKGGWYLGLRKQRRRKTVGFSVLRCMVVEKDTKLCGKERKKGKKS